MTILAYHVSSKKKLQCIEPHICDSEQRDRLVFGFKAACFTTTKYKNRLPDFSPYPRSADEYTLGYRYTHEFNPDDYWKFQMAKTEDKPSQVHFLLLRKSDLTDEFLAKFIRACAPDTEDKEWSQYFPGGEENDYNRDRTFVNVLFGYPVQVKLLKEQVPKRGPVFTFELPEQHNWYELMIQEARNQDQLKQVACMVARWLKDMAEQRLSRLQHTTTPAEIVEYLDELQKAVKLATLLFQPLKNELALNQDIDELGDRLAANQI